MDFIYNLPKKRKYLALSILTVGLLLWFNFSSGMFTVILPFITVLFVVLGTIFVQYTSFRFNKKDLFLNTFINIIALPLILILGVILSLIYYPNLGLPVEIIAIVGVGALMYISQLVDNIFLVVYDEEELIPLYRVAATWSQILMVVLSIPFYTGVFKIPLNSISQSLVIAVVAGLFTLFMIWVLEMDPDISNPSREERFVESGMVTFVLFSMSISTSFIATESFLRALFMSSLLMSALGYLQAHHRNKINKKLIIEYLLITVVFLFLVLFIQE